MENKKNKKPASLEGVSGFKINRLKKENAQDKTMKECCCAKDENKAAVKEECHCESGKAEQEQKSCCKTSVEKETVKEECRCDKEIVKSDKKGAAIYDTCCSSKKDQYKTCCGVEENGAEHEKHGIKLSSWIILGVSLISVILSFSLSEVLHGTIFHYVDIAWVAVILCGTPIFVAAFKKIIKGKVTSGVLISVSIIACIVLEILTLCGVLGGGEEHGHSYIFAAGEVAFLMALGEVIEEFTVKKARSGIERLMKLAPQTAKYKVGDTIIEKPVSEVKIGDIVVILPNDIISVDGKIVSGVSAVDESIMTGEAVPKDKKEGDSVYGGTLNKNGALEVMVTKTSDEMAVNKLKNLVEEAEGTKAPISKTADKWASVIVPGAIILSIFVFLITFFLFTQNDVSEAVLRGVTMLVVFCPCALALATPTAVAAGLGAGAKRGVLIKSGAALEQLAKVKTVAFDKTGTLTQGRIVVDDIIPYNTSKEELAAFAGSCESMSEHPIAKAITLYCSKLTVLPPSFNTKSLMGTGVESTVSGEKITVCKWENLSALNVDYSLAEKDAMSAFDKGKTVTAAAKNGTLIGLIILSDELKSGAKNCVKSLMALGIDSVMLTGDNKHAAAAIAGEAGIEKFEASLMPEDKLRSIAKLKMSGKVCMVGDGVNDAPALASADCSMAMGALGSDIAIETADIALMNNDITTVAQTVRFSKKVLKTIKINIIMSMGINILSFILNLFGYLNPAIGALIHNCSSVLVVINSALLLKRWR